MAAVSVKRSIDYCQTPLIRWTLKGWIMESVLINGSCYLSLSFVRKKNTKRNKGGH